MGLLQVANDHEILQQEEILKKILKQAFQVGAAYGYKIGYSDGVRDAKDNFSGAISDGLRRRSPGCGSALNSYKSTRSRS